jgi:hypothetical protein
MRHEDSFQDFNPTPLAASEHGRGEIAGAVIRKSCGLIEITGVIGTGEVGEMVLDADNLEPAVRLVHAAGFRHHLLGALQSAAALKMCRHLAG